MKRAIAIGTLLLLFAGCKAEIGDECSFDADCSADLDRNCDGSQPGGYCLIISCGPDECPKEASCVNFTAPCPTGPGYQGSSTIDTDADADAGVYEWDKCSLIEPNRGRTYCLKHCKSNGDCREKYQCVEPESLSASIIDLSGSASKICVPK